MQRKQIHFLFLFTCIIAVTTFLGSAAHAIPFPWENENSVRSALNHNEGQNVVCEASVERIAARNNPPYFVLRDEFSTNNNLNRIVVLCRPPMNLTSTVQVSGVIGRLPNGEPCILNPTVKGLLDQRGLPVYRTPFPEFIPNGNWQTLPMPIGLIPPSDPSLTDDGMGVSGEVSAYSIQKVTRYETLASLVTADPQVLSRIELSAKPIVSSGEVDWYTVNGHLVR